MYINILAAPDTALSSCWPAVVLYCCCCRSAHVGAARSAAGGSQVRLLRYNAAGLTATRMKLSNMHPACHVLVGCDPLHDIKAEQLQHMTLCTPFVPLSILCDCRVKRLDLAAASKIDLTKEVPLLEVQPAAADSASSTVAS